MTACVLRFRYSVQLLPRAFLYPLDWKHISECVTILRFDPSTLMTSARWANRRTSDDALVEARLRSSFSLHLFGFTSQGLDIDVYSPVGQLLALFSDAAGQTCQAGRIFLAAIRETVELFDSFTQVRSIPRRVCVCRLRTQPLPAGRKDMRPSSNYG